uniref:cytochrome c biogenesis protein ccs1 n=1 Tax=Lophurella stichidiosa TaxID=2008659 RepID=UPI002551F030|nr:cytochrome c biogenesis protein ccs1 [Aphanocladia stichidiosa]WGH13915.1 cytochrome c biogenesis protein ccs1 [Aphanocladia stichidiosa]
MNKNFVWKSLKKLANLNFSLAILSMIAFFCILGSILEQDKSIFYYKLNYPTFYIVILFLGLDHVFRTWWFILVLIVFIFSLLICTFSTQLPSLKNARRWKFLYNKNIFNENEYVFENNKNSQYFITNIVYSLIRLNFFVFYRNSAIYSYKGLYGRIAPIFVHFSIAAILLGSVYSFLFSFVVQEVIPKGEIFHLKNVIHSGFYSNLPSNIIFSVNDFFIDYNFNGSIKQFFTSLSISLNNNQVLSDKIISVNRPLRFFPITLYQTDWQIDGLRINVGINNSFIQKKFVKTNINGKICWLSNISINNEKNIFFVLFSLNDKLLICNTNGVILQEVNLEEKFYINNTYFMVQDVITSTGLQVKIDPGIFLVYFGFFVMMLSTFISYISYSQIWIYYSVESLNFLGSTNRASLFFERDIVYLNQIYSYYLSHFFKQGVKINSILA